MSSVLLPAAISIYPCWQFRDEAKQWANRLASYEKGVLSSQEASRLATTVRTSPRVWLDSFHDLNGIKALFIDQLAKIQLARTRSGEIVTVLMHMMDTVKSLMNTQYVSPFYLIYSGQGINECIEL